MSLAAKLKRFLVFRPPDPVGFWSARAKDAGWLSVMWKNEAYNAQAHLDQWAFIQRHLPASRGRMLDLGCGTGRLSESLAALFDSYVGVDLPEMVAEAKVRNPKLAHCFAPSTVQNYDFPESAFDLVLSMACLASACRAEEMPALVRKMYDSLRPGGHVIMIEPFHRMPALVRTCQTTADDIARQFKQLGAQQVASGGIHCIPVRLIFARKRFASWPRLTKLAYKTGETLNRLAPRWLGDYRTLCIRKP